MNCQLLFLILQMQLTIEPVKNSEIELLAQISCNTFYDTFMQYNTKENMDYFLANSFSVNSLKKEISEPFNHFFFAKDGNYIAGYLKLSTKRMPELDEKDVLEISRIYVAEAKLGSGVGKALMEFAFSFAKQKNKKTVCLGVWEHNQRAISFYTKLGFEKFGEHVFMLGDDAQTDLLMKKEI